MGLEVFAAALKSAPLANHFCLWAIVYHVRQMSIHSFVHLTVATVINTRDLLSVALASVLKSLVELVFDFTVFTVTCDCDPLYFPLLEVAQILTFKNFAAIRYRALGPLHDISLSTSTTKTVSTILMCQSVNDDRVAEVAYELLETISRLLHGL